MLIKWFLTFLYKFFVPVARTGCAHIQDKKFTRSSKETSFVQRQGAQKALHRPVESTNELARRPSTYKCTCIDVCQKGGPQGDQKQFVTRDRRMMGSPEQSPGPNEKILILSGVHPRSKHSQIRKRYLLGPHFGVPGPSTYVACPSIFSA